MSQPNHRKPNIARTVLSLFLLFFPSLLSHAEETLADRAKASFIYRCVEGMTWPESRKADSRWVIGIIGDDKVRGVLTKDLAGKTAKNRSFSIIEPSTDIRSCHIVFVAESAKRTAPAVAAQARENAILTIGETDDGFMIRFSIERERVRTVGDLTRMKQSGLKPSADLLRVLTK